MKKILLSCSLLGLFATANAQVDTIEENFDSFTNGALPQNGWNGTTNSVVGIRNNGSNMYIQTYSLFTTATEYIITPELTSIDGVKSLSFDIVSGGMGTSTVQIGVTENPDVANIANNFQAITGELSTATRSNMKVNIPQSTAKYIVFKITPSANHTATQLDNVIYKNQNLSVSDFGKKEAPKFAVDNGSLVFSDENVSNVKIFSANGSLVATEKVSNKRANISKLSTGVYFLIIEDNNGNITKSKFVKK